MIKKMNAQKGMLGLGLLKIVAQVSLFLVLLLTSSSSFALFCGLHVDADARITSSVHSHGEADHQDVSNSENHQSDDDDCHLT